MRPPLRIIIFVMSASCFAFFLLKAIAGVPEFGQYQGPYGDIVNSRVVNDRHTPQSVASVTFDYRGFDTMAEEFIFFTAVCGVMLLLRQQQDEQEKRPKDKAFGRKGGSAGEAVRAVGMALFPFTFLLGLYIIFHGHLTPGGGFQGGVLSASAFFFVYLTGEYKDIERFTPTDALDILEGSGAGAFVLAGFAGLLLGGSFMQNILPLGKNGQLFSAGTLPVLNLIVGLEVCAGFLLLLSAFLKQALVLRRGGK